MEITIDNYFEKRYTLFKWRSETSNANKLVMAFFMACLTGLMAQIVIPLPWTPVPITAQTFAVLFAGIILGRYWGGLSMLIYITIGLVGVPWFAGMTGGIEILFGASGGFLVGFVLAALVVGSLSDRYVKVRNFMPMLTVLLFANFILIYVPGVIGLAVFMHCQRHSAWSMDLTCNGCIAICDWRSSKNRWSRSTCKSSNSKGLIYLNFRV